MILSNVELHKALDTGRIIIRPEPRPRLKTAETASPYGTHSVDLTLAPEISIPEKGTFSWDLMQPGSIADLLGRMSKQVAIDPESGYSLACNKFILGKTVEWIELPILRHLKNCLAARIEGKSSRARCGLLVHFTAPTVHPGFQGTLTLEIINLGPVPFMLRPEMPIAQLIVEEVKGIPHANPSQFQGQQTPEGKAAKR
jgi:dCTP deaminase